MTIYIDADACPVTRIAEDIARKHGIPVTLLCDTNHQLTSDYSTVKVIGAGADAVDIALINGAHASPAGSDFAAKYIWETIRIDLARKGGL